MSLWRARIPASLLVGLASLGMAAARAETAPITLAEAVASTAQATQPAAAPAPEPVVAQAQPPTQEPSGTLTQEQIIERINQLENELILLKRAAGVDGKGKKIALAKKGIYLQGEIGAASRYPAYENQTTMTTFSPGLFGSVSVGYRYDRNFRFSFDYASINNAASKISPGIPIPVVDSTLGIVGVDGFQFPARGNIQLNSYTLSAYYDLNGFGFERRFKPYLGAGIGLQQSVIRGLSPAFFPFIGVSRSANATATSPVIKMEAGISYLFTPQAEFYVGGEYSFVTDFLFENTAFGTLVPNGSRNWIIKTGARYTF